MQYYLTSKAKNSKKGVGTTPTPYTTKEVKTMYKIIEKTSGYVITICAVNAATRKELETCGFICEKVVKEK